MQLADQEQGEIIGGFGAGKEEGSREGTRRGEGGGGRGGGGGAQTMQDRVTGTVRYMHHCTDSQSTPEEDYGASHTAPD